MTAESALRMRDPALLYWLGGFVLLLLGLGLAGELVNPWLRYDREAIAAGQVWRLVSCHLVHLNLWHLGMNLAGFLLCCYFFVDVYDRRQFLLWLGLTAPGVGLAIYFIDHAPGYYVGLSGLLHGWLVLALVTGFRTHPWLHGGVLLIIAARLLWEQLPGYDRGYLRHLIDGDVYVNGHLYGALGGLIIAMALVAAGRGVGPHPSHDGG